MGVIYYVGCQDCGTVRHLDKAYFLTYGPRAKTREDIIGFSENMKTDFKRQSFRLALICTFIEAHWGHNLVFFNEFDENLYAKFVMGTKRDDIEDYWENLSDKFVVKRSASHEEG